MVERDALPPAGNAAAGALIGTFVGDALGMPVEGRSHGEIREQYGQLDRMLDARMGRGTYTDDTQMMIATARSLIREGGVDAEFLAQAFLDHHDSRRGYGRGTTIVFNRWRQGVPVSTAAKQIYEGGSYGNGGSMRMAPVGVLYAGDPEARRDAVETACAVTHAHPLGIGCSFIQTFSVARALLTESPAELDPQTWVEQLRDRVPDAWDHGGVLTGKLEQVRRLLEQSADPADFSRVVDRLGCSSLAHESVFTALYSFFAHAPSFRDALVYAVGIGGDTDTIGAMTGALSGALHGVDSVPSGWWEVLENEQDGRDEVVELGRTLARMRLNRSAAGAEN